MSVPSSGRPRILATLPDVAWPLSGGKRLRCAAVLRGLAAAGDLDVAVLFSRASEESAPVPPDVAVERWVRLQPPPRGRVRATAQAVRLRQPVHVAAQRWDDVRRELADWTRGPYDLVWFGGLDHAAALAHDLPGTRAVVDCDDVETEKWRAFLRAAPTRTPTQLLEWGQRRLELPLWGRIQDEVARWADSVVVCSELDRARLGIAQAAVVPNTYPDPGPPAEHATDGPPTVLMIANFHTEQNVDAARFAVQEVLPRLRRLLPDVQLRLVGRGSDSLRGLSGRPGLELVGSVDSVRAELMRADLVIVPMRFGGGTRLKVLEAFAHGVPVVSTTLGAEGTDAVDGEHLLLRDEPDGLAEAAFGLVDDPARARLLASAGRAHYERHFTETASTAQISALVSGLLARSPARG